VLPPHARLREELLNLVRVVDRGQVHQDHCVAIRGVVASFARPVDGFLGYLQLTPEDHDRNRREVEARSRELARNSPRRRPQRRSRRRWNQRESSTEKSNWRHTTRWSAKSAQGRGIRRRKVMNEMTNPRIEEILDRVSMALGGERDVGKLLEAIAAAAPVDIHGSHEVAVTLAKAVASTPLPGVPNVGAAERDFAERARHLGFLAEHAGGVPESKLREVESDAAAVALAKTLKPIGAPPSTPRPDRREAIRQELARGTADGLHPSTLDRIRGELQDEEVREIVAKPSRTTAWGNVARPLTAA
jgi:hypothetical protein